MEKRFSLQQEEFSQNRLRALKESVKELQKEYPEILSLTLFGSLARGQSKIDSDIDGALYIDADYVAEQEKLEGKNVDDVISVKKTEKPFVQELKTQEITSRIYLRGDLYDKYNKIIQDKILQFDPSLHPEQVEHIRSLPMSEKELPVLLDELIKSKSVEIDWNKRVFGVHTGKNEKEEVLKTIKAVGGEPDKIIKTPTLLLGSMFHLDIGGGIRKYRKLVIDKLIESGEEGEMIWNDIIRYVERWEQKKITYEELPTNVHYPKTLAEAEKVYCH